MQSIIQPSLPHTIQRRRPGKRFEGITSPHTTARTHLVLHNKTLLSKMPISLHHQPHAKSTTVEQACVRGYLTPQVEPASAPLGRGIQLILPYPKSPHTTIIHPLVQLTALVPTHTLPTQNNNTQHSFRHFSQLSTNLITTCPTQLPIFTHLGCAVQQTTESLVSTNPPSKQGIH